MPYILNTQEDIKEMLQTIGKNSLEDLFAHIPNKLRTNVNLDLASGLSEDALKNHVESLAKKNKGIKEFNSFLGAGVYSHYIPAALNYLISCPQFVTAYTPYQAEISQGILQTIYEYQSYICLLTGMDVTNASLFDGASSLAEAALMALRINQRKNILVSKAVHPEYRETLKTYLSNHNFNIIELALDKDGRLNLEELKIKLNDSVSSVVLQSPNFLGVIEDSSAIADLIHKHNGLLIMVTDPFSLAVLKEPKSLGVDIVCGDAQALGGSLNLGGSSLGFLASKEECVRQMPGRIVGKTTDKEGRLAYCLTLQTREQHIRREKATSNICSNQSLHALTMAIYLALMGKEGVIDCMVYSSNLAHYLRQKLEKIAGIKIFYSSPFLYEFVWQIDNAKIIIEKLYKKNIIPGFYLGDIYPELNNCILSCCTETKTKKEIDSFISALKCVVKKAI